MKCIDKPFNLKQPCVTARLRFTVCVTLAYSFQQHSAPSEAYWILKESTYRFKDHSIWIAAAAQAIETKRYDEAADLLLVLAEQDPDYAIEAAEAYRQAGVFYRALYANTLATEGEDKVRQRLGLYIAAGDFVEACALVPRLNRWDILSEDPGVNMGWHTLIFKWVILKHRNNSFKGLKTQLFFSRLQPFEVPFLYVKQRAVKNEHSPFYSFESPLSQQKG